jgi:hypothetical protein
MELKCAFEGIDRQEVPADRWFAQTAAFSVPRDGSLAPSEWEPKAAGSRFDLRPRFHSHEPRGTTNIRAPPPASPHPPASGNLPPRR